MSLVYIIVFLALAGVCLAIFNERRNKRHKKASKDIFNSLSDFNATETYLSENAGISIGFDSERKKVCLLNIDHQVAIYDYKDILHCELDIDGEIVSKQSIKSTLGRTVIGGIGGGIGAVVSGDTGSMKQKEKVTRVNLNISINDSKNPLYKINFLNIETKKGDFFYNSTYEKAYRWNGIIVRLIRQANELEKTKEKI